ncbi:MDR/zinc-dependent alcohol dehydrogenase-like family protein [Dyadobacter sediminis]|uniref:Zinc-binding dehydrogenase n=1 Tax=Dyadobacter sediminis TaxID=1493691 RepID=A0A5R9KIV7_9BACT|nr:zinc-binding dehydrogenase [Dyadobacter sediminis]TLU96122.1 zinc-binding dehydrogenase [Dyadobacter sediminis]GGB79449.1 oxidoreductase [Dyadobacter sediminis]
MIAAVLTKPGFFELQKVEIPEIREDEVRIKVEGCGICASSLPLWEGREWFSYPVNAGSPGHEGWGIVDAVGDKVTNLVSGDRVAFLSGKAYAEYDTASVGSVVKLPSALGNLPFPGEPLGCAMNIFERSDISAGDTVAIIGMGFLGILLCQLAKKKGAKVIAVSKRSFSLDYAKQFGADEMIPLTSTWEVSNKISEITGGEFCTQVVEATGKQEAIDIATEIVAEGGRLIIAGYHQDGLRQVNMQKWNWKGIDVINAHERKPERYLLGMQKAVEAVLNGDMDPTRLYTDVLPLDQLARGFEMTSARPDGFMKALVQI